MGFLFTSSVMNRLFIAAIVVVVLAVIDVEGYPEGAPMDACDAARPMHTSERTNTSYEPLPAANNPYRFTVSSTKYKPGGSLKVSIEGTDTDMVFGFFLQARAVSNNASYGSFDGTTLPAKSQLRPCAGTADAVTHTDATAKTNLMFTWTAPSGNATGDIRFVGAVALNHDDFYVGITSATLTAESNAKITRASWSVLLVGLMVALFRM